MQRTLKQAQSISGQTEDILKESARKITNGITDEELKELWKKLQGIDNLAIYALSAELKGCARDIQNIKATPFSFFFFSTSLLREKEKELDYTLSVCIKFNNLIDSITQLSNFSTLGKIEQIHKINLEYTTSFWQLLLGHNNFKSLVIKVPLREIKATHLTP